MKKLTIGMLVIGSVFLGLAVTTLGFANGAGFDVLLGLSGIFFVFAAMEGLSLKFHIGYIALSCAIYFVLGMIGFWWVTESLPAFLIFYTICVFLIAAILLADHFASRRSKAKYGRGGYGRRQPPSPPPLPPDEPSCVPSGDGSPDPVLQETLEEPH